MNRYKSSQKWRKVFAGHYESPDGKYTAIRRHGQWHLEGHGMFLTLADCQEIVTRLEDPNDPMGAATESCGSCGADLGPSRTYPWHLDSEDCRAVREPVV